LPHPLAWLAWSAVLVRPGQRCPGELHPGHLVRPGASWSAVLVIRLRCPGEVAESAWCVLVRPSRGG